MAIRVQTYNTGPRRIQMGGIDPGTPRGGIRQPAQRGTGCREGTHRYRHPGIRQGRDHTRQPVFAGHAAGAQYGARPLHGRE